MKSVLKAVLAGATPAVLVAAGAWMTTTRADDPDTQPKTQPATSTAPTSQPTTQPQPQNPLGFGSGIRR